MNLKINKITIITIIIQLIIISSLIKGIKSDATTCQNKYEQEIFGGTEEGLEMVFLATGKDIPKDLGDYDLCNMLPDAHHCVITFGFNISGYVIPLTWGFCLPKECNEEYAPYALEVYISLFYSYASVADYPIDVYCSDTFKKNYSVGTIITLIIIILFGSFAIIGTIFKYFNISPNSQNQLKFKQNQQNFLNIKDNEIQKETIPKWKTILFKFFSFYSLQVNWKKLIEKHPDPSFKHLNGIRALSMFWIIFGHTVYIQRGIGYNNELYIYGDKAQISKWPFQFILGAEFAVDTFFFLSGLLMAHFAIEKLQQHKFNIGCFYFHRFWRLLPSLGFIILFFTNITMLLGNGPIFGGLKDFIHDTCGKHWYSSLLFFNNFYPKDFDDECISWVWYLANDSSILFVLAFIITSVVLNFWIVHHWNIVYYTFGSTEEDYSNKIYTKPYTRILPYLAGCLIAMLLNILQKVKKSNEIYKHNININDKDNNDKIEKEIDTDSENEDNQKLTEKTQLIESENENYRKQRDWKIQIIFDYIIPISIFVVSFILILVMVFVPYDNYKHMGTKWTVGESATYIGFSKLIWGLSVGGIVFVYSYYEAPKCLIKKFLSLDFWTPLAKLTYNAYLVHPIIMIVVVYSSRILYNYAAMPIFYSTTVYVILSYFFSMIVYFLVERPFMHFEREIITLIKGIKSDATTCQNKYEQEIFGGTEEGLEMVFLATGKDIPTDLGDYDLCNMLPDAHHCVITFGFNISGYVIPLTWGFCLPKECNEEYAPYALEVYISLFYSYASVADYPIDVYCSDTFKKNYSAGTIITLIIIVLFGSFVIIGTIFKYFNISPNSQNQLKFKQNQQNFLNIKDNEIQKETIPKWKTILFKFFSFYSLQVNWKKLIEKHPDPSFKHLNGIRALSMFWIIFGHTVYIPVGVGYNNEAYVFGDNGQISKWPFQFILGAEFAVDTFFFLSGLLMAHFAIEKLQQHKFNIGCFYFHR
ncbi:o-acyltransferase [Anaeramoeba ignava]|uniref:O-acyltransferase n=1 Tax=Anaeramoeba ignava TaxID=1746090 RepID=A0A9Q0RHN2_ANAIG|nr:o-acyltransferase [Anaeramoeba ignava]